MNKSEKKGLIEFRKATMEKIMELEEKEEQIKEERMSLWDIIYYIDNRIE